MSRERPPFLWRLLPRRLLSRVTGGLARIPLPSFLLRPLLRWYARRYGVALAEMGRPLASYRSFQDFFTRRLKPGLRPADPDPLAIVSPADGRVHRSGRVEAGRAIQVKGIDYDVADLLGSASEAERFEGGSYLVAYLAPGDYHRFHWPVDGRIERVRHIPGDLWPVNETAVARIPRLFVRNERVVVSGVTHQEHAFAFVPVGALNVGSIRLSFLELKTNRFFRRGSETSEIEDVAAVRGEECGRFELGSSIVLLLEKPAGTLAPLASGSALRVGATVGRLAAEA